MFSFLSQHGRNVGKRIDYLCFLRSSRQVEHGEIVHHVDDDVFVTNVSMLTDLLFHRVGTVYKRNSSSGRSWKTEERGRWNGVKGRGLGKEGSTLVGEAN